MSDDLRERVARAIAKSDGYDPEDWEGEMSEGLRDDYLANADAALAEMGDPAPVSVREAARVLCGSTETPFLEPASAITKGLKNHGYLVPVRILHKELRAIAEGKE